MDVCRIYGFMLYKYIRFGHNATMDENFSIKISWSLIKNILDFIEKAPHSGIVKVSQNLMGKVVDVFHSSKQKDK